MRPRKIQHILQFVFFSLMVSAAQAVPTTTRIPEIQDLQRMVAQAIENAANPGFFAASPSDESAPLLLSDDVVLEGETLQNFLEPIRGWANGAVAPLLNPLVRIRIQNRPSYSDYLIQWRAPVRFSLKSNQKAKSFELYELRTPAQLRLRVFVRDGVLSVIAPDAAQEGFDFMMRIPVIPDALRFRSAELDLTTGAARLVIGAWNNSVSLVANAQLYELSAPKLDLWKSFRENFAWIPGFSWIFG